MLAMVGLAACQKGPDLPLPNRVEVLHIPDAFPDLDFPEDNAFSIDRWDLGKRLFYDKALSIDYSVSCSSCHQPENAFATLEATNPGANQLAGTRNAPSLANIGYHPYFTREGGVPTLETQVLIPVQEQNEFDFNMVLLSERLGEDNSYQTMSQNAYNRPIDSFVITRALSTFERSLISGNSAYDQFLDGELNALTTSQKNGMTLFFSDENKCASCHTGFNFTSYDIVNNGLYSSYLDSGLERLTNDPADNGKFKVASLRNVALTPPYMHDGSLTNLEAVVEHYSSGGVEHPNKSELIVPLELSEEEKEDLIHFLESLSDYSFVNNPQFKDNE